MTSRPDSRHQYTTEDIFHDDVNREQELKAPAVNDMMPVPVEVIGSVATNTNDIQFANYYSVTIPASTATVTQVGNLLPRDLKRQYAYIMTLDQPIVLSTEKQVAQAVTNVGTSAPSIPVNMWTPAIRHNEAVYAANTSTSASTRVLVMVEMS